MINLRFLTAALCCFLLTSGCAMQRSGSHHTSTPAQTSNLPPVTSAPLAHEPYTLPPGHIKTYVVFDRRYFVMADATGYRERGTASWYGPKFNGRPTANGEVFDMHKLTAAHKSLPLPSYARITNLKNKRSVVVRINDRGPFVGDRVIDLSQAAARQLDMINAGTAPVDIMVLDGQPTPAAVIATQTPSHTAPPTVDPAPPVHASTAENHQLTDHFVQVGSFSSRDNAGKLAAQLEQSGFGDVIIHPVVVGSRSLHRVKIGPLATAVEASQLLEKLVRMGLNTARIVRN